MVVGVRLRVLALEDVRWCCHPRGIKFFVLLDWEERSANERLDCSHAAVEEESAWEGNVNKYEMTFTANGFECIGTGAS